MNLLATAIRADVPGEHKLALIVLADQADAEGLVRPYLPAFAWDIGVRENPDRARDVLAQLEAAGYITRAPATRHLFGEREDEPVTYSLTIPDPIAPRPVAPWLRHLLSDDKGQHHGITENT